VAASLIIASVLIIYFVTIVIKLGLHQRIPLAFGKISIEKISDRAARKYGDKILFTSDYPCSWDISILKDQYPDQFAWSAKRIKVVSGYLAKMLQEYFQIQKNETVAIFKQNHLDIHFFILSVIKAGGIACPINGKFETIHIEPYLSNIESKLIITDYTTVSRLVNCNNLASVKNILLAEKKEFITTSELNIISSFKAKFPHIRLIWIEDALEKIDREALLLPRGKDDILYLVHSSGTTGFPKAVVLQNGPQSHAIRGWLCYVHASRKTDKAYLAVPNNHQAVILSFNSFLLLGMRVHWTAAYDHEGFDAAKIIEELRSGGYTGFFGFPITYTQLKEKLPNALPLIKIRFWATTADASHEAIIKPFVQNGNVFRAIGIPVNGSVLLDAQGSSEVGAPSVLRYITPFTKKFERRIGKPGSTPFGPKIRIRKTNNELASIGEVGRLEVKGKTVFKKYWKDPQLTAKSFTRGWFFTGDVACMDKYKNIIQLDREIDVIHTENGDVYSLPIEEKIHKHPAVFDACVYGGFQQNGFQLPCAAIALRSGFVYDDCQLLNEFNELLDISQQLHRCDIIEWKTFPFGVTGKTLKRVFRERSKKAMALHASGENNLYRYS
jgi:acyl-coenzyme A synthetase/AMP-(fatty) acid ligase